MVRPAAHRFLLFLVLLAAAAAFSRGTHAAIPAYTAEPSGNYLREWLVCGPFPLLKNDADSTDEIRLPGMYTDYLAELGGEAMLQPEEGLAVPLPSGTRRWTRYVSPADAVSKQATAVAYAACAIDCPEPRACILAVGSNDGVRAWLNGEQVLECPASRGLRLDHNLVPVYLRKGRNRLLMKIEERGNIWRLACRLLPLDAAAIGDRFQLFEVSPGEEMTGIRPGISPDLLTAMLNNVRLEVVTGAEPERLLWQGEWAGEEQVPLDLGSSWYAPYILRVRAELKDGGGEISGEIPFHAGALREFTLFEDGRSDYTIVLGPGASESERWAASELQNWLGKISGVQLPIRESLEPVGENEIVIGYNNRVRALLKEPSEKPADHDESFCYRSLGSTILIWGGSQRGTMYGVMSFLERELGVRFYTPRVNIAPQKDRWAFTHLHHAEQPGLRVRNDFYYEAFDPVWAARNRINGAMTVREQPGGVEGYWSVHTFYPLMPPAEFFAEHPEYYSLIDGKRTTERAQLCLTNPDVLRIVTERIIRVMRENPQYLIYSVSQNDWSNPCQCAACQAIVDREGSQSGPILWFVNQVADRVRNEFPNKFIGTLAYSYTRKPPRTLRPRTNVVIRFCSIECCFAHPFTECPENAEFVRDMDGWAAIAPHIYIWDYVVNFSHYVMPYPNFRVLQPNLRFFRDHSAIGVMEQAAYQSRGGEFAELRAYLLARLLWDPEADVEPVIDDFMYGYYGRAGQHVRAYFDLLHAQLTPDTHIHLGLAPDDRLFTDAFVRDAEGIFDQAERVADNEEIRRRVEMARLPVMYLKCRRDPVLARHDGTYARFCEIVEREGITHYAEAGATQREAFHEMVESAGAQ
jgi:hypothetical protein